MPVRKAFEDRTALASALANDVASVLQVAIETHGKAVLAVSGGSTPKRFFATLSSTDIEWSKVTIMLVDERLVPETNERSNAQLVKNHLMQNLAATATFAPFYREGLSACATAEKLEVELNDHLPPTVAILGMGNDGHTASFFPGGTHLAESIDRNTTKRFIEMDAENAGETRMTLTLPPLLDAKFLALHIEGEEKEMTLLEAERNPGDVMAMPVRAVLDARQDLPVYWAP
jgi:6-phosphogluconolactonase